MQINTLSNKKNAQILANITKKLYLCISNATDKHICYESIMDHPTCSSASDRLP